ncbi:AzlD domain-containing protein [Halobacteriaceae archaeon GCM10025711]
MPTSYSEATVWLLVVAIGVLTFAIRVSFIALFGRLDDIPTRVKRALRFVPAAVLAALVAPAFVTLQPETGGIALDRLVAGGLAAAVAWRTENVLATMAAGMGALWVVRLLV